MSSILHLESVAGIAGDMFAASFLDAGLVTLDELAALPGLVGFEGVEITSSRVIKATMQATHLAVRKRGAEAESGPLPPGHPETHLSHSHGGPTHGHTHYVDLDRLLEQSRLDRPVKEQARKIFLLLAEAEAAAHGRAIADVAFHEIGTVDSIMDVVMAAYCVGKVGAARLCATPVKVGRGEVKMEHGTHPIPPPASARLLVGLPTAPIPDAITRRNVELSTPTGIAILKALSPQFQDSLPAGKVLAQGMGAGTMDLGAYPNVFRVMLIEETASEPQRLPYEQDQVMEIVCNIDDDTAERIAWVAERLLQLGALDVWIVPVTGKKGRPAVMVSVLATNAGWPVFADWLLRHSSTFGIRYRAWDRLKLVRKCEQRATSRGPVAYKTGLTTTGEILKDKPEFEDLRRHWERPRET